MRKQIIESILDTDLYKLTMQQAVVRFFPDINARYELILRKKRTFPDDFAEKLLDQITLMQTLKMTDEEEVYLRDFCPYFSDEYRKYLSSYRFDASEVCVSQDGDDIRLSIEGPWYRTILWEVPLMAMISELYFSCKENASGDVDPDLVARVKTARKAGKLVDIGVKFSEFGTRRRYSREIQKSVSRILKSHGGDFFAGTSNVSLAMSLGMAPVGTMAHEWIMAAAACDGYVLANNMALRRWWEMYGRYEELMIGLSDTFTSDAFFSDGYILRTSEIIAEKYRGVRQDSGDPLLFLEKACSFYNECGVNAKEKTIVFSDALNVEKVMEINEACDGRVKDVYGIGTNFTNNLDVEPLNMVIKLVAIDDGLGWVPTVKLSDDAGKTLGPDDEVNKCMRALGLKK